MTELHAALRRTLADRDWWKKILVGGVLWLTGLGWPIVEGYQLESIDNTQRGFPTPLPRWNAFGDKIVVGLFAMVIDFFFFLFPILICGILLFRGTLVAGLSNGGGAASIVALVILIPIALYLVGVWCLGVSAVGKQRYVAGGDLALILSGALVRELLSPPARGIYLRARLDSLPPYMLGGVLLALGLRVMADTFLGGLIVSWLGLSALLFARLAAIQIFHAATRALEKKRFELRTRRAET